MNAPGTQTPYYWLDPVADWRGTWTGLEERPSDQSLVLEPLPTAARQLFTNLEQADPCVGGVAIECPVAIAADACHGVYVIDGAAGTVFQGDASSGAAHELSGVGGHGPGPREFGSERSIAILSDGSFAVLDVQPKRIAVFSPDPFALTALIALSAASRPGGMAATPRGLLLVTDTAQNKVLVFDREGRSRSALGENQLTAPTAIAIWQGVIAVLDQTGIVIFSKSGKITRIALPAGFRYEALCFDEYGAIYAGALPQKSAEGSIVRIATESGTPVVVGFGPLGLEGRVTALANLPGTGLIAIVYNATNRQSSIWQIDPQGAYVAQGVFISDPLDSRIDRCAWHRVVCEGQVPPGTSLTLETVTGASAADLVWSGASPGLTLAGSGPAPLTDPDFLIQSGPGRFLRFRLTVRSSVASTPVITGIRVEFPRQSYLQYLPAVLQEDPEARSFLDRFLSLFQTYNDSQDDRIDHFPDLFNPASVPSQYLGWLAAIVALPRDPTWPMAKRRQMLTGLFQYHPATNFVTGKYPARGTPAQVAQDIADYSGVASVGIFEHYRLRTWLNEASKLPMDETVHLWSRDIYQRLQVAVYSRLGYFRLLDQPEPALEPLAWGAHRFSVFFAADPYTVEDTRQKVAQAVEMAKPAHTQAILCPVLPRFRVEYQSTIGIDTVLGGVNEMILNQMATLDYDSVLAAPAGFKALVAAGVETVPRAGITARLL